MMRIFEVTGPATDPAQRLSHPDAYRRHRRGTDVGADSCTDGRTDIVHPPRLPDAQRRPRLPRPAPTPRRRRPPSAARRYAATFTGDATGATDVTVGA